jgi:hypothetical protein
MSAETVVAISSVATFIVIATTAIAALIQLRHLRANNQMTILLTLMQMWSEPEMQAHIRYMRGPLQDKLKDASFLGAYGAGVLARGEHPELLVADFWEQIGAFMKYGLMDEKSWLDVAAPQAMGAWDALEPAIRAMRATQGISSFENFEYAAVRAGLWMKRNPDGTYPRSMPRMEQIK